MDACRPARSLSTLLIGALLAALLLSACQNATDTIVSPAEAATATIAPMLPGDPTLSPESSPTRMVVPATWTPTPTTAAVEPTLTPSRTATPHYVNTITAATAAWQATTCEKYSEAWQIFVERSWRSGWCDLNSARYSLYEYVFSYPSEWKVNTFGEIYPNIIFATGLSNIDLRLYQLYSYDTLTYTGSLEEAPEKAAFCNTDDLCHRVVDSQEKLVQRELLTLGAKNVLVLDSQYGDTYVRRYFFKMLFTLYPPRANRLFMMKLTTPAQISAASAAQATSEQDAPYQELMYKIETIIGTMQQAANRK